MKGLSLAGMYLWTSGAAGVLGYNVYCNNISRVAQLIHPFLISLSPTREGREWPGY